MTVENNLECVNRSVRDFFDLNNYMIYSKSVFLGNDDIVLYKIDEITYEDKFPRKEAIENILGSLRINLNFIYLVVGDGQKISFYLGLAKDLCANIVLKSSLDDIGANILQKVIRSNFRGSKVTKVAPDKVSKLLQYIGMLKNHEMIEGVPGEREDKEKFQGMDRLVDSMIGDQFVILLLAKCLPDSKVHEIENRTYHIYNELSPYVKKTVQKSSTKGKVEVNTTTTGTNTTYSTSKTKNYGKTMIDQRSTATKYDNDETRTNSKSIQDSTKTWSEAETNGNNTVNNETKGFNENTSDTMGSSRTLESKNLQAWLKYIDEVILKRIDYGKGKGIYVSSVMIATDSYTKEVKLRNQIISLFSGSNGNKVPIRGVRLNKNSKVLNQLLCMQIPVGMFKKPISDLEKSFRTILSQYIVDNNIYIGNWLSSKEMSVIAGFPQKEVIGLPLREEVEFGLNVKKDISPQNRIELGNLVQSGQDLPSQKVYIDRSDLSRHVFVTGVTGSGKTTTCQNLLLQGKMPFCVIEPAKTEYRILTEQYDNLLVFTLGKERILPFRLNPFEFFPHESISSHVDMVKACINSSFDTDAAIPQIIETALYKCYEDCGWDIVDDTNSFFENPFAEGVYAFPTLSELVQKTITVVEEQGFDERLKDEYIGSIRARLLGLTAGSKGLILNTYRSINFRDLLHRQVIIELENVRSGTEKSLIMGFILAHLVEAIKAEFYENPSFRHITLLEEAHRLLSRYESGDSLSKKQGVEMFTDMLAEVRKYGESIIIADQIPSKLTSDVLKNTNTKIVHKIFAQDDKEAIGNTMALSDEQKRFLSSLKIGYGIVFSQGWDKGIQTHMKAATNTTTETVISDDQLKESALLYLYKNWNLGAIPGIDCLEQKPSYETFVENMQNQSKYRQLDKQYGECIFKKRKVTKELAKTCQSLEKIIGRKALASYILKNFYFPSNKDEKRLQLILYLLEQIKKGIYDFDQYDDVTLLANNRRKSL